MKNKKEEAIVAPKKLLTRTILTVVMLLCLSQMEFALDEDQAADIQLSIEESDKGFADSKAIQVVFSENFFDVKHWSKKDTLNIKIASAKNFDKYAIYFDEEWDEMCLSIPTKEGVDSTYYQYYLPSFEGGEIDYQTELVISIVSFAEKEIGRNPEIMQATFGMPGLWRDLLQAANNEYCYKYLPKKLWNNMSFALKWILLAVSLTLSYFTYKALKEYLEILGFEDGMALSSLSYELGWISQKDIPLLKKSFGEQRLMRDKGISLDDLPSHLQSKYLSGHHDSNSVVLATLAHFTKGRKLPSEKEEWVVSNIKELSKITDRKSAIDLLSSYDGDLSQLTVDQLVIESQWAKSKPFFSFITRLFLIKTQEKEILDGKITKNLRGDKKNLEWLESFLQSLKSSEQQKIITYLSQKGKVEVNELVKSLQSGKKWSQLIQSEKLVEKVSIQKEKKSLPLKITFVVDDWSSKLNRGRKTQLIKLCSPSECFFADYNNKTIELDSVMVYIVGKIKTHQIYFELGDVPGITVTTVNPKAIIQELENKKGHSQSLVFLPGFGFYLISSPQHHLGV